MHKNIKKQSERRLKIIEGQIRGLGNMIKNDKYCVDIIHQSFAVKEALSSFEDFILKNHLSTHVVEQMKSGKSSKAVDEMLLIYKLSKRR